jgi:hypothetical protein
MDHLSFVAEEEVQEPEEREEEKDEKMLNLFFLVPTSHLVPAGIWML